VTTDERRERLALASAEDATFVSAQAEALIVIADVLTELADGIKWCGHGYIEALCPGVHPL
jgi:hypothetical protein